MLGMFRIILKIFKNILLNSKTIFFICRCGSGSFVLDVAPRFPNSKFYGIDTAPMYPSSGDSRIPPNVSFSQVDIVEGLPFDDNTFDFVHLRFLVQYLTEEQWNEKVIKELLRVTKVGGWIEIMELDLIFYDKGPNTEKLQESSKQNQINKFFFLKKKKNSRKFI